MKQPLKLLISIANEVEELADMDSDALSPYEQYLQKRTVMGANEPHFVTQMC